MVNVKVAAISFFLSYVDFVANVHQYYFSLSLYLASIPPGITPEMYMQAITATMPTEPPPQPAIPAVALLQQFRAPPKNPTPQPVDMQSMLEAAKAHMQKHGGGKQVYIYLTCERYVIQ